MTPALFLVLLAAPRHTLPETILPVKHTMELTIDPAKETFSGIARIDIRMTGPQAEVWLNARDLTIGDAHFEVAGKSIPAPTTMAGGEFVGLTPEKPLTARDATIVIRYSAPLSATSSTGPYHAKTGEDWYAFTTFTPTDARRAFPSFDEPRFKTPWQISIRVPKAIKAFSNAPELSVMQQSDGWTIHKFAQTKPIPAEVVAFAVGPFDVYEGLAAGVKAIPIRVLTARGDASRAKQATIETAAILPRLEHYTGIPYPWEKLDHVALPRSAFGAVENPGLITYSSRGLLTAPSENIRSLQAHEIGHQWFGNLVTQATWTDVWLSEGFATWFASRTMDEEQPADRKQLAAVIARERIMKADDGDKTRPIRMAKQTREELGSVYHQIVYQKGGALLHMIEEWIGPDNLQRALRDYLASHAYGNATTEDLEAALKAASPVDPTEVVNGFLNTTGVPRISVEVRCDDEPVLKMTRVSGNASTPVCWKTGTEAGCRVVADVPQTTALQGCPAWVFPNRRGTGYYRTVWTPAQLKQLAPALPELNGAERLTLLFDLKAMNSRDTKPLLTKLTMDVQPEIAKAAKIALGLEKE